MDDLASDLLEEDPARPVWGSGGFVVFMGADESKGETLSTSVKSEALVIKGRMAVTIVEVAEPPTLKKILARSNSGYTFLAWTMSNNARPITV